MAHEAAQDDLESDISEELKSYARSVSTTLIKRKYSYRIFRLTGYVEALI